ncbi:ABC transporter substrate-binding protein [Methylomusa anaerophila]|nr:ABC transporter substrate-binding protein [Methylomusa anaerophila]
MLTSIIVIIAMLLLAGCSSPQQARQVTKDETTGKTLDVIKLLSPYPTAVANVYIIADKLGFFKEEGIKPEFVGELPSTTQLVAAVTSGQVDVGGKHVNTTISGIAAGAKVKMVAGGSVTTKDQPHMIYVVKADSPIKSPQDLVGKRVGISGYGGCTEYTPLEYLHLNGGIADPKGKFETIILPEPNLEQALLSDKVDVIGLHLSPQYVQKHPDLRILFTDYDVWGERAGACPAYVSEKFIKEKPDVVKRFVAAVAKANNWVNANPDKALDIIAQELKVDKEKIQAYHYADDGIITDDSVQVWIDILNYYHDLKPGIKAKDLYTNEFNPNFKNK